MPDPRPTRAVDEAYDASMFEDRAPSVGHLLRQRIADTPDNTAYSYPSGIAWDELTWAQLGDRVWQLAAGLVDLGIRPEDRVSLASSTRIEWVLADYAIMAAGAATTTIYPTSISDDVAFIVDNSGSRVVIAEDAEQVGKLRQVRDAIPEVMTVVVVDTDGVDLDDWVISFEDLEARGAALLAAEPGVVDARIDATGPQSLATIIYTSGTTGRPKGVRLRHATWTYQGAAIRSTGMLTPDDVHYLWLPLSHVFAKVLLLISTDVGMQTAVDGRIDKIVDNLGEVRPTFMAAAPRIFEKVYGKLSLGMQEEGGAKAKIFDFASATARQYSQAQSDGRRPGLLLGLKHKVADKLVFAKVRDRFGGRVRFFISGSAALNTDIAHWFNGAGLPILEGYGLTETSAAATVNRPYALRVGTVGWPNVQTEIKVAEDGEILVRGEHVMEGYHNNPEATAEVLTEDGWFHTGDIGEVDADGFVKITDRKKDLFKTSNGKYVAPSQIESTFKGLCPYVGQLLVHGENRQFVTALVTLDEEAIQPWAEANGLADAGYTEIVSSMQAREMVQSYVDELNAGLNRHEQIKRFHILGRDLTVEDGELTPSLKLRRKVVADKFKGDIEEMYPS
ncbi:MULTISPECIES: AMP-dependent synthetase/ligase [Janibacter]|uniref:AMP-dependent synthetase/ligase n=1 Tax=Janibacter TaxID=53457 RepID=UPI0021A2818D|nr:long-chain fatty acid--CoA ligase [Janibacter hoylei]MCT1619022.1 long-chain fatty acid--CoA ligase [Janibacter hoylei]MCT2291932.1 long-chain fatty acid--CoA ligase [Janibacter hoylei]